MESGIKNVFIQKLTPFWKLIKHKTCILFSYLKVGQNLWAHSDRTWLLDRESVSKFARKKRLLVMKTMQEQDQKKEIPLFMNIRRAVVSYTVRPKEVFRNLS